MLEFGVRVRNLAFGVRVPKFGKRTLVIVKKPLACGSSLVAQMNFKFVSTDSIKQKSISGPKLTHRMHLINFFEHLLERFNVPIRVINLTATLQFIDVIQ